MDVRLVVVHEAGTAPYEQVRTQLADAIVAGRLGPGTRLPTVRGLADDLGLAANTVARAYRELERAGLVVTRGRRGTFVASRDEQAHDRVAAAARRFAEEVRSSGVDPAEALRLVREVLPS